LGGQIGKSLCEDDRLDTAKNLLSKAKEKGVNIYIPTDAVIADNFANDANIKTCKITEIPDGWMGLDAGPETIKMNSEIIQKSKTILWNGPMGVFEMSNFENGTKQAALDIVEATKNIAVPGLTNRSEGMILIPHANRIDFWLITHQNGTDAYTATLIDATATFEIIETDLAIITNTTNPAIVKVNSTGLTGDFTLICTFSTSEELTKIVKVTSLWG
jgi:hypothetical protein